MHEKLLAKVNDFKLSVQLPLFPGRKFFGRTNDSQDSIRTRGKELQDYLQIVLNLDKLWVFQTVKEFLPPGEDDSIMIMPSKSEYSKDRCWTQMDELKRSFLERQEKIFEARNVKKGYKSSPMVIHGYSQRYYFSFEDYTELNETIVYTICLTDAKHNKSYRFTARYSDIRGYHVLLKKNSFKQILPKFPKRKIIGQTNDNPLEINERMEQLQSYLNSIFGYFYISLRQPEFERCDIMQYFISKIKMEEQSHSEKRMSNPPLGSPINMSSDRIIEQKSI